MEVGLAPEEYHTSNKEEIKKTEGFAKEIDPGTWGTDKANFAVHNFEDRSDKYVIPSKDLFLGHFPFTAA